MATVSRGFLTYCPGPWIAHEANVEHELVPLVFFIVDDSGETAYFVAIDVQGDGPVRKLRLRDDVGEDVVVLVRYGVILSRGVTAHRRTLDRMELGKEYAPDRTLLAASFQSGLIFNTYS